MVGKKYNNFQRFNRGKGRGFQNRRPYNNTSKEYSHQDQLSENEVGITEFISKLDGFSGIIKARFSDFQVNEIDLNGHVAKLTDTSIPKDSSFKKEKFDITEVTDDSPIEQIPEDTWKTIKNMISAAADTVDKVELDAEQFTKEDRTKIHECLKKVFGKKIVASTVTNDGKKSMQFKKYNKADESDIRSKWPADKPEYVHFLVYKESLDTMEAAIKISDCLRMSTANFSYAGVKDKRAKTTQWFSVRQVEPWKLIVKTRPLRNVKIGNITFKDEPLKLGHLSGNKFRIALRNVSAADDLINASMEGLKTNGFINYYGLQRFGNNKAVPTFSIGISLLLGNWKEATNLILRPKLGDDPLLDISKAKTVYSETNDAEKALKVINKSKNKCVEYKLLLGLSKGHANDYVNALENIPRNMRLLYLHSFQSLIWNQVVSQRIKAFGMKPVEGDLVLVKEEIVVDQGGDKNDDDEENCEEIRCKQEVKALTEADKSNYTIYDVVLPLPGYDVMYPENLNNFYKKMLAEHGLNLDMPKQKVKTYTLSGTYRKMLSQVKDLSWKTLRYDSPTDNLIRSDFEELRGNSEPKSIENGQYKALVMEFSLDSSAYATMVLREILKTDTSTSNHAKLNNYHVDQEKKIMIDEQVEGDSKDKYCEIIQSSSLLSDPKKYDAFKNSIFNNAIGDLSSKRKNEEESVDDAKKFKQTTTSEESSIKMEPSMV